MKRIKKNKTKAVVKDKPRLIRDPSTGLAITKGPANGPTVTSEDVRTTLDPADTSKGRRTTVQEQIAASYRKRHLERMDRIFSDYNALLTLDPRVAKAAVRCYGSVDTAMACLTDQAFGLGGGLIPIEVAATSEGASQVVSFLHRMNRQLRSQKRHLGTGEKKVAIRGSRRRYWRIVSDPAILGGTLVFSGTRVPVKNLIEHLEAGDSFAEFLLDFPSVRGTMEVSNERRP